MRSAVLTVLLASAAIAQEPPALPKGLYAVFNTSEGVITAQLYEKDVPLAVANFVALAQGTKPWRNAKGQMVRGPLYDGVTFHRVIRGEMIQAGDPTGTGSHNCGVTLRDEFLPGLRFDRSGRLAVANTGEPDSGGCQFFITVDAVRRWDMKYSIFGQVVRGMDVVERINRLPGHDDKPVTPAKILSVTIQRVGPEPAKKKK
ncbi:MAG TPA: peptidylprolyl isomerase [Candidatus Limnocylindrales bacterium]|nr:peptidylprolyl isomerase [Candidatus Limnocylindrales bacterium]